MKIHQFDLRRYQKIYKNHPKIFRMLGKSKLTKIFIYFLYLTSSFLFISSIAIFFMLSLMNYNLFPLFMNKNGAIFYEIFLVFYISLIALSAYFCFTYVRIVSHKLKTQSQDQFIKLVNLSVMTLLLGFFLHIRIMENMNVRFVIFNAGLVADKLDCCFDGKCDVSCHDLLKQLFKEFNRKMFYANGLGFCLICLNLSLSTLLLLRKEKTKENIEDELSSLRKKYSSEVTEEEINNEKCL